MSGLIVRFRSSRAPGVAALNPEVVVKVRIAIAALAALAVLGACGKEAETKGGTVQPASSSETTTTTAVPSTTATTAKATTTTAKAATTTTTAKAATTTTEKATTTTTEAPTQSISYANCSAAKAAGAAPLHRGEPGYSTKLDRDGDGVACES